jgi:hypothetical protein
VRWKRWRSVDRSRFSLYKRKSPVIPSNARKLLSAFCRSATSTSLNTSGESSCRNTMLTGPGRCRRILRDSEKLDADELMQKRSQIFQNPRKNIFMLMSTRLPSQLTCRTLAGIISAGAQYHGTLIIWAEPIEPMSLLKSLIPLSFISSTNCHDSFPRLLLHHRNRILLLFVSIGY